MNKLIIWAIFVIAMYLMYNYADAGQSNIKKYMNCEYQTDANYKIYKCYDSVTKVTCYTHWESISCVK